MVNVQRRSRRARVRSARRWQAIGSRERPARTREGTLADERPVLPAIQASSQHVVDRLRRYAGPAEPMRTLARVDEWEVLHERSTTRSSRSRSSRTSGAAATRAFGRVRSTALAIRLPQASSAHSFPNAPFRLAAASVSGRMRAPRTLSSPWRIVMGWIGHPILRSYAILSRSAATRRVAHHIAALV